MNWSNLTDWKCYHRPDNFEIKFYLVVVSVYFVPTSSQWDDRGGLGTLF